MSKDYSLEDLEGLEKKQKKTERWVMTVVILVLGISGILLNWHFAISRGMYNRLLAFLSPALIIGAIYSVFFPNDFTNQSRRKLSFRMWIAIILGLLLCCAHLLAFEFGFF
jgi:predicted membrane channel-forming protein YqfA (hemolysin III family)